MKTDFLRTLHITLAALLLVGLPLPAFARKDKDRNKVWEEKDGVVVIEVEETGSRLSDWEKKTEISGYSGECYLEFTGNSPTSGSPGSDITFEFKINKSGLYYLALYCARERVDGRDDLANDCYVAVDGDFEEGLNAGNKHGMDAPKSMLEKRTKFFGGKHKLFEWAHGNRLDPGGDKNKRVAVYYFKAGETYEIEICGRSQLFKLDKIAFFNKDTGSYALPR